MGMSVLAVELSILRRMPWPMPGYGLHGVERQGLEESLTRVTPVMKVFV